MVSNELQYRIHQGDREAFAELFRLAGKDVYLSSLEALADKDAASEATKRVFMALRQAILTASGPIDVDAQLLEIERETFAAVRTAPQAEQSARPAEEAPEPLLWPDEQQAEEPSAPAPQAAVSEEATADAAGEEAIAQPKAAQEKRRHTGLVWTLLAIAALLLIWLIAGVLMELAVLARVDLGYGWFNAHVFPLFWAKP